MVQGQIVNGNTYLEAAALTTTSTAGASAGTSVQPLPPGATVMSNNATAATGAAAASLRSSSGFQSLPSSSSSSSRLLLPKVNGVTGATGAGPSETKRLPMGNNLQKYVASLMEYSVWSIFRFLRINVLCERRRREILKREKHKPPSVQTSPLSRSNSNSNGIHATAAAADFSDKMELNSIYNEDSMVSNIVRFNQEQQQYQLHSSSYLSMSQEDEENSSSNSSNMLYKVFDDEHTQTMFKILNCIKLEENDTDEMLQDRKNALQLVDTAFHQWSMLDLVDTMDHILALRQYCMTSLQQPQQQQQQQQQKRYQLPLEVSMSVFATRLLATVGNQWHSPDEYFYTELLTRCYLVPEEEEDAPIFSTWPPGDDPSHLQHHLFAPEARGVPPRRLVRLSDFPDVAELRRCLERMGVQVPTPDNMQRVIDAFLRVHDALYLWRSGEAQCVVGKLIYCRAVSLANVVLRSDQLYYSQYSFQVPENKSVPRKTIKSQYVVEMFNPEFYTVFNSNPGKRSVPIDREYPAFPHYYHKLSYQYHVARATSAAPAAPAAAPVLVLEGQFSSRKEITNKTVNLLHKFIKNQKVARSSDSRNTHTIDTIFEIPWSKMLLKDKPKGTLLGSPATATLHLEDIAAEKQAVQECATESFGMVYERQLRDMNEHLYLLARTPTAASAAVTKDRATTTTSSSSSSSRNSTRTSSSRKSSKKDPVDEATLQKYKEWILEDYEWFAQNYRERIKTKKRRYVTTLETLQRDGSKSKSKRKNKKTTTTTSVVSRVVPVNNNSRVLVLADQNSEAGQRALEELAELERADYEKAKEPYTSFKQIVNSVNFWRMKVHKRPNMTRYEKSLFKTKIERYKSGREYAIVVLEASQLDVWMKDGTYKLAGSSVANHEDNHHAINNSQQQQQQQQPEQQDKDYDDIDELFKDCDREKALREEQEKQKRKRGKYKTKGRQAKPPLSIAAGISSTSTSTSSSISGTNITATSSLQDLMLEFDDIQSTVDTLTNTLATVAKRLKHLGTCYVLQKQQQQQQQQPLPNRESGRKRKRDDTSDDDVDMEIDDPRHQDPQKSKRRRHASKASSEQEE